MKDYSRDLLETSENKRVVLLLLQALYVRTDHIMIIEML